MHLKLIGPQCIFVFGWFAYFNIIFLSTHIPIIQTTNCATCHIEVVRSSGFRHVSKFYINANLTSLKDGSWLIKLPAVSEPKHITRMMFESSIRPIMQRSKALDLVNGEPFIFVLHFGNDQNHLLSFSTSSLIRFRRMTRKMIGNIRIEIVCGIRREASLAFSTFWKHCISA